MNSQLIFCFAKTNFRMDDRTLHFEFKNAWKMLAFGIAEARSAEASRGQNAKNEILLRLLNEIRTFFEENPDAEF